MNCFASFTRYVESRLFFPPRPLFTFPHDLDLDRDVVPQQCSDLYFSHGIASIGATKPNPKHTILYFHGNNENILKLVDHVRHMSDALDSDVYAVEYPGYTSNTGTPSEAACYQVSEKFAVAVQAQARAPVVAIGFSMGCAPALRAANAVKASATVLLAPFVSAASVVLARSERWLSFSPIWAPVDVFRTLPEVRKLECPTLVIHGTADDVVPFFHGRCVQSAAKHSEDLYALSEVKHSIAANPLVLERIRDFLGGPRAPGGWGFQAPPAP